MEIATRAGTATVTSCVRQILLTSYQRHQQRISFSTNCNRTTTFFYSFERLVRRYYSIALGINNLSIVATPFYRLKLSLAFATLSTQFIPGSSDEEHQSFIILSQINILPSPRYGLQLISNRALGPGRLQFTAYEDIAIHLHSPHDVPYTIDGDIKETILYGSVKEIVVSVIEMTNDLTTRELPIEKRKCRFYWELTNVGIEALYNHYSHSTCTVECSRFAQLKFCNCTHHLMPRNWRDGNVTCDYKGLTCLTDNFSKMQCDSKISFNF